jgi:hypothetical protein
MGLYSKIWRFDAKNKLQQGLQMGLYFTCPSKFPLSTSILGGPPNPLQTWVPPILLFYILLPFSLLHTTPIVRSTSATLCRQGCLSPCRSSPGRAASPHARSPTSSSSTHPRQTSWSWPSSTRSSTPHLR